MPLSPPSLSEQTRIWGKIGVLSFGGPAAQIALMHEEVVEKHGWLSERQFLNALNFCMLLPGPEAMQLATYVGWTRAGTIGGLIAGLLFVLPGAVVILMLATIYAYFGQVPMVEALFEGVKAAVLVLVFNALWKVAGKTMTGLVPILLALGAFVGLFFFNLPYPLIVAVAAAIGAVAFAYSDEVPSSEPLIATQKTLSTALIWAAIWAAPFILLMMLGGQEFLLEIGAFFSKLAIVTFGGAYAVLAYMAQDVVNTKEWLTAGEMMDGLGLAETTPGPLILVTEFTGFLAGYKAQGFAMGLAAAVMTLWVTFAPCFLWIFVGAPYLNWLTGQPRLSGALKAITAAVVGVILNLSLWFALNVMFGTVTTQKIGPIRLYTPDFASFDWNVLVLAGLAALLLLWRKLPVYVVLLATAIAAITLSALG